MRVVVTGATGLIGSTVTRLLRSRGEEVVTLSRNRGRSRSAGLGKRLGGDRQLCSHCSTDEGGNR